MRGLGKYLQRYSIGIATVAACGVLACGGLLGSDDDDAAPSDGGLADAVGDAGSETSTTNPTFFVLANDVAVSRGTSASTSIGILRTDGFAGAVDVSADGLPLTLTVDPLTIARDQKNAFLIVHASLDATPGNQSFVLHASSNGIDRTTTLRINVGPGAGAPDTTFRDGTIITDVPGGATSIVMLSDDHFLVGASQDQFGTSPAVAKYDRDGNLDATFADGGIDDLTSTGLRSTGTIVIQGNDIAVLGVKDNVDAILRLELNGTVDPSFGGGAVLESPTVPFFSGWANGFVQPDGKLVVVAGPTFAGIVARFNADGGLDTTFGNSDDAGARVGYQTHFAGFSGEADLTNVLPFGDGILAIGYGEGVFGSYVLPSDGSSSLRLFVSSPTGCIPAALRPGTGPIVGCGATVLAYQADGGTDAPFGGAGFGAVTLELQREDIESVNLQAVLVQSDGKILVGGTANFNGVSYLARLLPNGQLDTSFGTNGVANVGGSSITALARQSDGKIVAVGSSAFSNGHVLIARFWP